MMEKVQAQLKLNFAWVSITPYLHPSRQLFLFRSHLFQTYAW